ncbi:MAG: hypothetical protein KDB07_12435, partial [Planctomycetes bacterium]|nr:hypothetical protein [Planctomycetota bacterium]
MRIDQAAPGFKITFSATIGGLVTRVSNTFDIMHGTADHFVFTKQPNGARGGEAFDDQPALELRDLFGNRISTESGTNVNVAISANPAAGTLSGPITATLNAGLVSFSGLTIDKAGAPYRLIFTRGAISIESADFAVSVGAPASIVLLAQPADALATKAFGQQPVAEVRDLGGNLMSGSVQVTAAIQVNAGGGSLIGSATQGTVMGVASYSGLGLTLPGDGYVLRFSVSATVFVDSQPFDVIAKPALIEIKLDDHNNNGEIDADDELYFHFNEELNTALIPINNLSGQLDAALGLSGTLGVNATAALETRAAIRALFTDFSPINSTLIRIRVTSGETIDAATTSNPSESAIQDLQGLGDLTPLALVMPTALTDVFRPTVMLTMNASPSAVGAGPVTISAVFSDVQTTTPTITIQAPGSADVIAQSMTGSGKTWSFTYLVMPEDGFAHIDGLHTISVAGNNDARANIFDAGAGLNFTTDTSAPIITSFAADKDCYGHGEVVTLNLTANQPDLNVTANLSVLDPNFPS